MRRARQMLLLAVLLVGLGGAPRDVAAAPGAERSDWGQLTVGAAHSCAIRTNGRLFCWGSDAAGQLGNGAPMTGEATPVPVVGGGTWISATAGNGFTCGIRSSGRLYCWGSDSQGQLGNGNITGNQTIPVEVAGGSTNWASVSAGDTHTCARRTTGRLFCWGSDSQGQLGDGGPNAARASPTQVAGAATNWAGVRGGGSHTCARRTTGRLYCWGSDNNGQLGNGGANVDRTTPGPVAGGLTTWTSFDVGFLHSCGRRTTGRLYCWGNDFHGQVGDGGANADRAAPVPVGGTATWTTVAANAEHTCARATSGRLFCWGHDGDGQLGNDEGLLDKNTPTAVAGADTDWTAVDGGYFHTCARITSGRLFCWGSDSSGQLGNGTVVTSDQPVPYLVR